jgi:hypothetical protein
MPFAWLIRDVIIVPVTWLLAWTGSSIEWRGATISAARPASLVDAPAGTGGGAAGDPRREMGS